MQFPIAPFALQAGDTLLGPFTPGAGFNVVRVVVDVTHLISPLTIAVDTSLDGGQSWGFVGSVVATGPWFNKFTQQTATTNDLTCGLGNTSQGPTLSTATQQFRVRLTTGASFASSGGTLTLT